MGARAVQIKRNYTTISSRGLSPALWSDCPLVYPNRDELVDGVVQGDDFHHFQFEDGNDGPYQQYIDTGNTIRLVATSATAYGGQLALITDATDNDGPVIQYCGAVAAGGHGPFFIGNTAGAAFKLWFEARVKISSIADDIIASFVGLAATGRAADNGVLDDNAGDLVDSVSFIGFHNKHTNSGTAGTNALCNFSYQDGAQTAPTVALAAAHTYVADAFVNLGFQYDPEAPAAKRIKIFVNNVEQGTYVTNTQIDAATFPENDALAFVYATKNGTAGASTGTIDWWRCAQVYSVM